MSFQAGEGTIACRCVIEGGKPVLFVSHAGGDWQMYCHDSNHDFDDEKTLKNDLRVVHITHLAALDPALHQISDLPADMGAERTEVGGLWMRFEDRDSNE